MQLQNLRFGREPVMLIGSAILTGLTLVFPILGFLEWITMIPLFLALYRLCEDESFGLRRAYRLGFLTVFSYYLVLYHWFIRLYPLDFVGLDHLASAVIVVVAWLGLALLQALPGGLYFLLFRWMHKVGLFDRFPILKPFVFSGLWVVFEWTSTLTFAGVPWGRLALGQIKYLPMLQTASLFGSYFVSFLILLINGLLAYAIFCRAKWVVSVAVAGALLVSNLSYGLIARAVMEKPTETVRVAVIQGNISSHEKWSGRNLLKIQMVYEDLTRQAVADGAELILWPETVLPYALNERGDLEEYVSDLARECNVTLILGSFLDVDVDKGYNVLYFVEPDGTIRNEYYAKRHLVPFGEYVPMKSLVETLIPPLAELTDLGGELLPGKDTALFETQYGTLGSLICFDSIYETLALQSVRDGAEIMLVSSNDSWFYDSAAVYQHEAQSQLRAIECGRYFVRSANTGISTVIAPDGKLLVQIDPLEKGYAVAEVSPIDARTPYSVIGNLFIYIWIVLLVGFSGVGVFFWARKKKKR